MTQPIETQMDDAPGPLYVQRRDVNGKRFNWDTEEWETVDLEDTEKWKDISKLFTQESVNYYVIPLADIPAEAVARVATDLVFARAGDDPAPTDKCFGLFNSQAHEVSTIRRTLGAIGVVHGVISLPGTTGCGMPTVQKGAIGTTILLTMLDEEGDALDLATATDLKVRIGNPDGTVVEHDALLHTDGIDGVLAYVTEGIDLDDVGTHKMQGFATVDGEVKISTIASFKVLANLEVTED